MKKAVMVSTIFLLLCSMSRGQETAPPSPSGNRLTTSVGEEARIKMLEDHVRSLAEEVALLRGEL